MADDFWAMQTREEEVSQDIVEREGSVVEEGAGVERDDPQSENERRLSETDRLDNQVEEEAETESEEWDDVSDMGPSSPSPSATPPDLQTASYQVLSTPYQTETAHLESPIVIPTGPRAWVSSLPFQPHIPLTGLQSLQWRSPRGLETDRYLSVQAALSRIAPNSPFVPSTLHDWLSHRLAWIEDQIRAAEERLLVLSRQNDNNIKTSRRKPAVAAALAGRTFPNNRSAVLAQETIWCTGSTTRHTAPWPTKAEYQWEGDARARSGFHRFPPIPRAKSNETVVWHQKPAAAVYEFDRVGLAACVPYTEAAGEQEQEDGEAEDPVSALLMKELWRSVG